MKTTIVLLCASLLIGCATAQEVQLESIKDGEQISDIRVKIKTTKGEIDGILYASKTPMTVANFVNLSQKKYYDGIVFHRVIPNFMAQVGDPLSKDPSKRPQWGQGGPGYTFGDEFRSDLRHDRPGIFSMANAGPGTNGSQIFITHVPTPHLDGKHTVFGSVTKGQDVVDALKVNDKIISIEILDNADALLRSQSSNLKKWNAALGG